MARLNLASFTGGERRADMPGEFTDGEWAQLRNLVFEGGHQSVRTIWPMQPVVQNTGGNPDLGDGMEQVFILDNTYLVVRHTDDGWFYADLPGVGDPDPDVSADLAAVQDSPPTDQAGLCITSAFGSSAVRTKQAILLNGVNALAAGVIRDLSGTPDFYPITNRYPNAPSESDALPKANVGEMWGDFLVLGDIEWLQDDTLPFSSGNAEQYTNGLWFSQPGKPYDWDILDVEFVGPRFLQILGMAVIDNGLLVATSGGMWILRGSPILHEIVQLSDVGVSHVVPWPAAGGGAWVQNNNEVWWTDGLTTRRLDRIIEPIAQLVTLGDHDSLIAGIGASMDTLGEHDTFMSGGIMLDHDRNPLHA